MLEVKVWWQSVTLVKEQGSHDLDIRFWGTKGLSKRLRASNRKGSNPFTILFYSKGVLYSKKLSAVQN
jgi:hypothetical protein